MRDPLTLAQINDYWNYRIKETSDMVSVGLIDYWKTPLETFMDLQGDCEDYAMAKYCSLVREGYANISMLTTVLTRPNGVKEAHVVTVANGWVLDNVNKNIVKLSNRFDLERPTFISNHRNLHEADPRFTHTWNRIMVNDELKALDQIHKDIVFAG